MVTRYLDLSPTGLVFHRAKRAARAGGLAVVLAASAAGGASAAEPPERGVALASAALVEMPAGFLEDPVTAMGDSLIPMGGQGAGLAPPSPERNPVAVPLSEAVWLFAAGLIGFILLSNRRSA